MDRTTETKLDGVAIIGMACRFPGATTPVEFWENLQNGRESISFFSNSELTAAGVDPSLLRSPEYVKAAPVLDDVDMFDAEFFRCSPKEATMMDPQQRFFLECAWEALENAGYDPAHVPKRVGVYAGALVNTYLLYQLTIGRMPLSLDFSNFLETLIASDKDFLATRTSYKLNLKGPSLTVQTACSTGLVAVHLACQSLLNGECETALAGAVSIRFPHRTGYQYREGGMVSPDGHCRPFSDRSQGTVFGSGVGIVVLKRLDDAIADRDCIRAVIRGPAINNDGSAKMSYTAPSIDGHAEVVVEALAVAGVDPGTIGYVEAHGTATDLGDPVEIAALTQAFRHETQRKQFCAIGSVKSNIGHLDAAAGIAGLIKTVLALEHGSIPPTLHFERPNPKIDLAASPFYVNTTNVSWKPADVPRRAGVSSLGVGGTNAHAILEQPPDLQPVTEPDHKTHLLVMSARTTTALQSQVSRYRAHLLGNPDTPFGNTCYTAAKGRHHFDQRVAVVAGTAAQAAEQLARIPPAETLKDQPRVGFLFGGQGSQYPGMARRLYDDYPVFRRSLEAAQDLTRPLLEQPLLDVIFQPAGSAKLNQTIYTQPAILAIDLALYDLWRSWGIVPAVVMGHSLGEYAAAAAAGVFRREDAFRLICERARLMQDLCDDGAMAAVRAPAEWTIALAREIPELAVAALNAPDEVVISGKREVVLQATRRLEAQGGRYRLLPVSQAFHSNLMDPILDRLELAVSSIKLSAPGLPIVSNLTGRLAGQEMTEPAYWRNHARQVVRFADGMETMSREGCRLFIEAGPGSILLGLGASCLAQDAEWYPSIRKDADDERTILESLGHLYSRGVEVDWNSFYAGGSYRRVPLPTYPFERKRYWASAAPEAGAPASDAIWKPWLYALQWHVKRIEPHFPGAGKAIDQVVIIADRTGFASQLDNALRSYGIEAVIVPESASSTYYSQVAASTAKAKTAVVYLSALNIVSADLEECERVTSEAAEIGAGLAECGNNARFWIVTRGSQSARGEVSQAGVFQSALWGLACGIEVEHPEIWGGIVDLDAKGDAAEAEMLAMEIISGGEAGDRIAYRDADRLTCQLVKNGATNSARPFAIHPDGTYLITGGTGGVGRAVAQWLVDRGARHLILTSRNGASPKSFEVLRSGGANVQVEQVDASDLTGMQDVLRSIESTRQPLRGVFHAAGIMRYQRVKEIGKSSIREVLQTKAMGAWILHELTQTMNLDCFVLFSSMSSVLAGMEMGAYAAANAFLDSLAHYRRSVGLPTLAINWGPWDGRGMGEARAAERVRSGVALLDPGSALACLASLLTTDASQAVVANVDWPVFRPLYESRHACSLLEEMPMAAAGRVGPGTIEIERLRAAAPSQQRDLLGRYVRTQVLTILGIDPVAGMDSGKRLFEVGLDSLKGAIELRNKLQSDLGCTLPATASLSTIRPSKPSRIFSPSTLPFLQKSSARKRISRSGPFKCAGMWQNLSEDDMRRIIDEELVRFSRESDHMSSNNHPLEHLTPLRGSDSGGKRVEGETRQPGRSAI